VSFLTPLALALATFAVPIILLYMLRLRRREVPVSSTLLWERLLRDREANVPWQRLRRNLLLFLQLLILAALVLALARPFREVPAISEGSVTLLLDASASMNATDVAPSRFERARQLATEIINGLSEGNTMSLIEVGPAPRVLVAGAADKDALLDALNSAAPTQAEAGWDAALALGAAGAQSSEDFSVVIISDGGLPDDLPALPGTLRYIPVGASDSNLAITALSARPAPGAGPELFAQITNFGAQDMDVIFSLELDDGLYDAAPYTVPAKGALDISLSDLPRAALIRASLTRPVASAQADYLAVDDTAWAVYQPQVTGRVLLVSPGNVYIEQLLLALPGVQPYRASTDQPLPSEPYDLYIFDTFLPDELPPGDLLIIGPDRSTEFFEFLGYTDRTRLVHVAEDDPRMAFVTLSNLHLADFAVLRGADWATPLAEAEGGPIILAGETRGRQIAIIAFDVHHSDLPLQIAWPVLMANLMQWFSPARAVDAPDVLRPAESLLIRPPLTAESVLVTRPDGSQRRYPVEQEALSFGETSLPGFYSVEVRADGETMQTEWFAVNLFAPAESDITPREEITIGTTILGEAQREAQGQEEFWPWVALVGLLVLLVEWYVYHRGMRLPARMPSPLRRVRR
jgi:Ca-activated chloride channel family protein